MKPALHSPARLESLYAAAVRLYPPVFHEQYADAMRQAFRDALADSSLSRRILIPQVLRDLATSLTKEHLAMLRDTFSRPALLFNALVLAGISTVLALALYAIPQQVLRQDANDPQLQLADDLVARLEQGAAPTEAVPAGQIDMARSLSPFVIVYDDQGRPLASQAQLDGSAPAPPVGVFEYVRRNGEERVSWQPRLGTVSSRDQRLAVDERVGSHRGHGLRIAAVVQRVGGAHPGFVLAGRSMQQVEERIGQVEQMAGLAWLAMLGLILMGTVGFGWMTRRKPEIAA
jgi:hypothetical protein